MLWLCYRIYPNMPLYMKMSYEKKYVKITLDKLKSYKKG